MYTKNNTKHTGLLLTSMTDDIRDGLALKPLFTFGTETKKVHRFTNNLQG